ncbi:MAG: glycoside hydrolase family 9 protein [Candidatus Sulfopaludibacter sp.]|nr:glycoside hydrolase family 9 protein [Candidatus Sulfopaludibacter sp.]
MFIPPRAVLLTVLFSGLSLCGADVAMKVTDSGYLNTQGFSVILYNSTYHPIFVDQKNTAMEMILHGQRIATNGDVRLMPTPEQWDLVAQLKGRQADKENNRLTANLSFPDFQVDYRLEVAAEPGGVRVSINLDKPLPEKLAGRAGFNLEFLPSIYIGKTYSVDGRVFGVFPLSPQGQMIKALPPADEPKKLPYQQEWDEAKGYTQPLPFASGRSVTMSVDDPLSRIRITSETGPISLYDGRNRSQNGWFVLRTLIPAGKTDGAVVWHIRPDVIPNWTRPPMVAHSQAGYAPDFPKVAVMELDPRFNAPKTARVLRLADDGSYRQAFEGPLSEPTPWLRYTYAKFDFSSVKDPGLYAIEYAGQRTGLFPIAKDVYSKTWQSSLDGFLAVEMDHVSVREGYRLWHGVSHLDDARQAPPNTRHFDGYSLGPDLNSPFKPGEHIPGLNAGGWFDAGDYDNIANSQYSVIQDLSLAYTAFNLKWDELAVDENARTVEMHRPDGVPDAVQQVKHGILLVLAQIKAVGHPFLGIIEPNLREYTHLGDAASQTDGRIYSPKLGPLEVDGNFSGIPDDRWAFTTKSAGLQYGAAASLAAAARVLKGWDDALAKECLDTAVKLWEDEHAHPTPSQMGAFGGPGRGGEPDWTATLELLIATNGAGPYKQRVQEFFPTMLQRIGNGGWAAVRALPYLDAGYKTQLGAAVKTYVAQLDKDLSATPFGVPPSMGTWGGSAAVADLGIRMYFLHKAFPDIVGTDYTLRAANYLLGTHPVSSTSYVSSVGTSSKVKAYGNNRADNTFIPGGVIPGYIVIKPDFPECIDDFGFLWFEDEYVISDAARWILAANAADAIVR